MRGFLSVLQITALILLAEYFSLLLNQIILSW